MTTDSSPHYDDPVSPARDDAASTDDQAIRVGAMGAVFPPVEEEPLASEQAQPEPMKPTSIPIQAASASQEALSGPPELEPPSLDVELPIAPTGKPRPPFAAVSAQPEPTSADIEAAVEEEFRAPESAEEAPAEVEVLAEVQKTTARAKEAKKPVETEERKRSQAAMAAGAAAATARKPETPAPVIEPPPSPPPAETGEQAPPPSPPPESQPDDDADARFGCLRDVLVMGLALLLGASAALLVLYVINGTLDYAQHPRFKLLESDVATVRQDVHALSGQMSQAQEDIVQLDARLNDVTARTDAIEARLDSIDQQLIELKTSIDELNDGMDGIDERVKTLAARLDSMEEQLTSIDQTLTELNERLNQTEEGVDRLDERLGLTEEEISAARERLQVVAERSQELQGVVKEMSAQLAEVEDAAERFRRFVSGLEALLNSMTEPQTPEPSATITPTLSITAPAPLTPTGVVTETASPVESLQPLEATQPPTELFDGTPALRLFPPLSPLYRPNPGLAHIFGLVWEDVNENGIPDEGERPLADAVVTLHNARGKELAVVITDEDGRYLFANLEPGLYIVVESDPEGTESITPNAVTVSAREDGLVEVNFADR
ncbi:MAG: hypothetical protein GXP42_01610 [Chloroflexi bacterium]|nr:hypothetical protein [Chloroflexota bacterium]